MSDDAALVLVRPDNRRLELARERLRQSRLRTTDAWAALRAELAEKSDWHTWYRARPGVFLAVAFVAGTLLARRR